MEPNGKTASSGTLGEETLAYLRRAGTVLSFGDEEAIVRRGDPGTAFYVVLSGTVEVRLATENACHLPLVTLGEGAFFGEMSILTGMPVSADVVATGSAKVLSYPAEHFSDALTECVPLRDRIMVGMARNVHRTTRDAWNFFQRAEALNVLMDSRPHEGSVVAEARSMKKVLERVETLPAGREPVLISGPPGSGKTLAASLVHRGREKEGAPFMVLDCRSFGEKEALSFIFGTTWSLRPAEQGSIHSYGAVHLSHGGTLVLRHVDALAAEAREVLYDYLESMGKGRTDYPCSRIIATSNLALSPAGEDPSTDTPDRIPVGGTVAIPPLRERRRDILPLAELFLENYRRRDGQTFSLAAEHTLVSRQYTHRNVDELREAVEMASLFSEEPQIEAEHIFTGPKDQGGAAEYPIGELPAVRKLTSQPVLKALRWAAFVSFAAIIFFSLFFSGSPAGKVANAFTWSLWEPSLIVIFLLVGRLWCTICPLSMTGRLARKIVAFNRQPEAWLKKYTGWLIALAFAAVVLSEKAFHMIASPAAAAGLLLALAGAAVFFSILYQRETWCRYLCPLGNLGAVYSLSAVTTIRANPSVCSTLCRTHECYKGSDTLPGCPVFHHPLYARDAHHCKQCCTCLSSCPHGSARLYLRPPLRSIWKQGDLGEGLLPFALFLFFFSPFMLAAQGTSWTATTGGFTFNALVAFAATVLLLPYLPRLLTGERNPDRSLSSRAVFSLLVLSWGPAMAYQLDHVTGLDSIRIRSVPGSITAPLLPEGEISLQLFLQVGVIVLAFVMSMLCLWGIRAHGKSRGTAFSTRAWRSLLLVCALYCLAAVLMVLPRGIFS